MSKIRWSVEINTRVFEWIVTLTRQHFENYNIDNRDLTEMIEILLLRQLQHTPGVDLSRSPYSEPKGVSNGKREAGNERRSGTGSANADGAD